MPTNTSIQHLIEPDAHRKLASAFFNEAWRLLDLPNRSGEQDTLLVHCAHASRMHWEFVGDFKNRAIGEWQISRVYSVLQFPQSALYHATLCLAIVEAADTEGFMVGCAHEAIARALALTDKQAAAVHHRKAVEILSTIDDPEDAGILRSDLASIEL